METDLEKALDLAGAGKYQVFHVSLMVATLLAAMLEMIGCSFVLPIATCDLQIPDNLKGILTSIPNLGVILSAPLWGRAADTLGRKPVLLVSSLMAGCLGLGAAFTSNLLGFGLCKLAASFFLSCPSSLGFAYASEMLPRQYRDFGVLLCNGFLTLGAVLSPIFAWGVLSYDWQIGSITLAPWRVLSAVYAVPLLLAALWVTQAVESPKFLVARGKNAQALDVLRHIYASNTGQAKENFYVAQIIESGNYMEIPVDSSSGDSVASESFLALLRPPHFKWLALIGFSMFGLFSVLNGLFLFVPDTINKLMSQSSEQGGNLCALINQTANKTGEDCVDDISFTALQIMVITGAVSGGLAVAFSFCHLSKKMVLIAMFLAVGAASLLAELTDNRIVAGVAMSTIQVTALGIGPLTAYAVYLFPTSLRGTAVGAVLMFGRIGSVVGSNVAGRFLPTACYATVSGFTALLLLCAVLSFLLPKDGGLQHSR